MNILNTNYDRLPGSYLFSTIAKKIKEYQGTHENADIIRLGIGDVTSPIIPAVIEAMHKAVNEMGVKWTFRGYGPEQGYDFLREAIIRGEYTPRGIEMDPNDVFVSDGSKCDVANIQELFSADAKIAIPDPVYPVYLDSNVMAGRTGTLQADGHFSEVTYLASTAENNFQPDLPKNPVQLIAARTTRPVRCSLEKRSRSLWITPTKQVQLFCSMEHTTATSATKSSRTPFTKFRALALAPLNSAASVRPPDSRAFVAHTQLSRTNLKSSVPCGTAVSALNSMA